MKLDIGGEVTLHDGFIQLSFDGDRYVKLGGGGGDEASSGGYVVYKNG